MAKINTRQICFIMLVYTAVTKLAIYPTQLSAIGGRDLLFCVLANFLFQGIFIWATAFLCSRTDKTFFELVEGRLGKITAKIVYALLALFFALCAILPMFEQKVYVHAIFYDTLPSLMVFVPVFFLTVYASSKGFENAGRCADICFPVFLISIGLILAMSLGEANWDNFLPVLKQPERVFFGSLATLSRFCEPAIMLVFMGHFKYKKGDAAKITLSYAVSALFVLAVVAAFYGIYGEIAQSRQFAVSKISLFFPAIDLLGRIDLFALYALEIPMLFAFILYIQLTIHCIEKCTGYHNKPVLSVAVNAVFLVVLIALDNELGAISDFGSRWMWMAVAAFANVLPLTGYFLRRRNG